MKSLFHFPGSFERRSGVLKRTLLWLVLLAAHAAAAQNAGTSEYELKAVFLFNFLQFVDWPDRAFHGAGQPISICILGPDPFGSNLDAITAGERIGGRSIEVRRHEDIDTAASCHLLFVNVRSHQRLRDTLERLKGRPILTVSDVGAFSGLGGMIEFVTQNERIRLRVNLRATTDAQLRLSSKLLRHSEIVGATAA